jgi:hypothetical protein
MRKVATLRDERLRSTSEEEQNFVMEYDAGSNTEMLSPGADLKKRTGTSFGRIHSKGFL